MFAYPAEAKYQVWPAGSHKSNLSFITFPEGTALKNDTPVRLALILSQWPGLLRWDSNPRQKSASTVEEEEEEEEKKKDIVMCDVI
ncbi:hypothetical protein PoB_007191600 [Plakobranchus ocellatus]|uniref:Uncharacterized protein n=1 Tax=Plakobranchus ocellatus TaxID=259542 RepID=A0AAV4DMP9_9GAST|nr:hypothetical protein PoB_007191600 [Plakobranchus ocellatus]